MSFGRILYFSADFYEIIFNSILFLTKTNFKNLTLSIPLLLLLYIVYLFIYSSFFLVSQVFLDMNIAVEAGIAFIKINTFFKSISLNHLCPVYGVDLCVIAGSKPVMTEIHINWFLTGSKVVVH